MVAYFSMEVALEAAMPTYAGGLGVLAGDFLHSAADLGVPVVAVTLLHRKGYFRQRLDSAGRQHEEPLEWPIEKFVQPLSARIQVSIGGRQVVVRAWERTIKGVGGTGVPVYFLDTDLSREHRGRPRADALPVWRRCGVSAGPGSSAGPRRGADVTRSRVRADRSIPSERRSLRTTRYGTVGGTASRFWSLDGEHRGRRERAACMCLHHAHARPGRPTISFRWTSPGESLALGPMDALEHLCCYGVR